mmetsp:Transcript_46791/g.73245  ORF Transcript_46791/g.73245 Transcript_46791/m.73245 type:complete len:142 (+) Transcript_46791:349-774(+)
MRCECGIMRDRAKSDPAFCSHEGFDHHEEYCCNCLLKTVTFNETPPPLNSEAAVVPTVPLDRLRGGVLQAMPSESSRGKAAGVLSVLSLTAYPDNRRQQPIEEVSHTLTNNQRILVNCIRYSIALSKSPRIALSTVQDSSG